MYATYTVSTARNRREINYKVLLQGGAEHKIPIVISKISKEQKGKLINLPSQLEGLCLLFVCLTVVWFSSIPAAELSGLLFIGDGILRVSM